MTTGANYQRINLLIDSSQRQNAGDSNSNFSVNLSNAYQVKLARLKKACIPLTYYNITSNNNFLQLGFAPSPSTSFINVGIPIGRWTIRDICLFIQNFIQPGISTFQCIYVPQTSKVSMQNTGGTAFTINSTTTIGAVLGFTTTGMATSTAQTSDSASSLIFTDYLQLTINSLTGTAITVNNAGNSMTFLLELDRDIMGDYFGSQQIITNYVEDSGIKNNVFDNPLSLSNFKVALYDRYGNILNLNGVDWWAVIELNVVVNPDSNIGQTIVPTGQTSVSSSTQSTPSYLLSAPVKPAPRFPWLAV